MLGKNECETVPNFISYSETEKQNHKLQILVQNVKYSCRFDLIWFFLYCTNAFCALQSIDPA